MTPEEQLLDYRRRVAILYSNARDRQTDGALRCLDFRHDRDELFRHHPQSALSEAQKSRFDGLRYYAYDPALRFELPIEPVDQPTVREIMLPEEGAFHMRRFGQVHFSVYGQGVSLSVYWIMGYGGGIFLPLGDLTNGHETYGGGRYLLDTIKGADLGQSGTHITIDFNYAYNPSCAYNVRWVCPLSPAENRLPVAIRAGEMTFDDYQSDER
jgi:uncharacterized protein (DUF1684 family)